MKRKWVLVVLVVLVALVGLATFAPDVLAQASGGGGGGGWVEVPPDATSSWWDAILQGIFWVAMIVGAFALLVLEAI